MRWYWWTLGTGLAASGVGLAVYFSNKERGALGDAMSAAGHVLNAQSFVDVAPSSLAAAAGVDLNVYALASCMQSEKGSSAGMLAIGCVVRNYANQVPIGVAALLTRDMRSGVVQPGNGHFGSERTGGRYAATSKPPWAGTLSLAAQILAVPSPIDDPTGGATKWDGPLGQDAAHARDPGHVTLGWADLKAKREGQGFEMVVVPGIPESETVFWRRAG